MDIRRSPPINEALSTSYCTRKLMYRSLDAARITFPLASRYRLLSLFLGCYCLVTQFMSLLQLSLIISCVGIGSDLNLHVFLCLQYFWVTSNCGPSAGVSAVEALAAMASVGSCGKNGAAVAAPGKHNCKHHCQTSVGSNMHVFRVKCKDCNKELFRCNKKLAPSWLNLCQQRMQEMVGDAAVAASPGSKKGAAVAAPDSDDGDSETCYYSDWEVLDGTNPVCTNNKHGKRSNSKDGTRSAEPPTPYGLH
jgi:hypothetical protein